MTYNYIIIASQRKRVCFIQPHYGNGGRFLLSSALAEGSAG